MNNNNMNNVSDEVKELAFEKIAQVKIYHLYLIIGAIDVAMSRGAFKGSEASQIGAVYDTTITGINKAFEIAGKEYEQSKYKEMLASQTQTQTPTPLPPLFEEKDLKELD